MKAFITGSAGMIGYRLAELLQENGWQVTGCDNFLTSDQFPPGNHTETDIRDLRSIDADVVFHLAAVARVGMAQRYPQLARSINIEGTRRVLEATKARVVFASSSIIYAPGSVYHETKVAAETLATLAGAVSLRFACVYGPRQSMKGDSPNVIAAMKRSKIEFGFVQVEGDGLQTRDFLHVDDAARALMLAATSDVTGPFDICTGTQHTILSIAERFECPIVHTARRPHDASQILLNPAPAEAFGFRANPLDLAGCL